MKKTSPFVLTIFFVILITIPLSWIFKGKSTPEESVVEARTLVALRPAESPNLQRALSLINEGKIREGAESLLDLFINASFAEKFERATSDQFPFRMPIIQFSKGLEREIIKLSYSFTNDPVIPADMTNDIYYDTKNDQLLEKVNLFNQTTRKQIDKRIKNYEDIIQAHPEQRFYVFYHQIIDDSEFHPMAQYFSDADKGQSITYFENHLPEGLKLGKFELSTMDDYLKYYYRTDVHWNVFGILRAYEEIYNLLSEDYPEISPMLEYEKIITFPDIKFLGVMARRTFYPIEGDDFTVAVIDFPSHEMKINEEVVKDAPRYAYFEGNYSTIPYVNHYNDFYGWPVELIEYTFDNDTERNLLIFGSSFRNALDPLLASHYNKTYCVDLRYYTDFSLSDFLAEHKIDDVLILGDYKVALQRVDYWIIGE